MPVPAQSDPINELLASFKDDGAVKRRVEASATALAGMDPHRRRQIRARIAEMPLSSRSAYLRAAAKQAPPRLAIKAHCMECCGWERRAVAECTGYACPLWEYRPFQSSADSEGDEDDAEHAD